MWSKRPKWFWRTIPKLLGPLSFLSIYWKTWTLYKKKKYRSAEIYWLLALKEPKLVYKASNKNFSLQIREKSGCVLLKINKFCSPQTEVCWVAGCLSSCPLCLWLHGCWWLASIWSGGMVRVIIQLFKEWRWFFLLKELPPEAITFWHQNRVRQHLFNTLELS